MNDIAYLPVVTTTKDSLGQTIETEDFTKLVFCEKKSISGNEFFQAGQNGIKSSCILVVYQMDYKEETKIKYREKVYSIYRTYERKDEKVELYMEVRAGG